VEGKVTGVLVPERLRAFDELVRLSAPRLDTEAFREARALLERVRERRLLSLDHTVVAFAGTTGSGKSSLFNAVCGLDLSLVSARRPTTSAPIACVWQAEGATGLLDRLGVPGRMRFGRPRGDDDGGPGAEDPRAEDPGAWTLGSDADLAGLVLLDLPDHDSVEERHRAEVDRLIALVDVVVWVLDPEKYADASVHERYLRPLAGHADVMLVVLNQIDRLPEDAVPQCAEDLRRLLDEDGLAAGEHGEAGTQVLVSSALTGEGVAELRETLGQVVRERGAANRRIRADLDRAVATLRAEYAGRGSARLAEADRERFLTRLGEALGAGAVGEAAEREVLRRAARAGAAPWGRFPARWAPDGRGGGLPRWLADVAARAGVAARGRPWRADDGARDGARDGNGCGTGSGRPGAQRAMVDEAVCEVVETAAAGLPDPWARGLRKEGERGGRELARAMGTGESGGFAGIDGVRRTGVPGTDGRPRPGVPGTGASRTGGAPWTGVPPWTGGLPPPPRPRWWTAVAVAQWLLLLAAVAGGAGCVARAAGSWVWPWWLSVALAFGAPAAGAALARVCVVLARAGARRHGHAVERRLREVAEEQGRALVLAPLDAELWRYREARERYAAAVSSPVRVAKLSTTTG
jgi:GTP-binding protein EngB required for normal cell division